MSATINVPRPSIPVSQTGVIFWSLLVGFIVYVTSKGHLPAYIAVMWVKAAPSTTSTPTSQLPTNTGNATNDILSGEFNSLWGNPGDTTIY